MITTNIELKVNLARLIKHYSNISFAVAWASAGTDIFKELSENRGQIRRAVIGTHFYQTHPAVLETFVDSDSVRFILQSSGVFHPKIYIFWGDERWEALMGSANLTAGALNNNSEAMILISDQDESALKKEVVALIDSYWAEACAVTKEDADSYRKQWAEQQSALRKLSGRYKKIPRENAPADVWANSMGWEEFFAEVQDGPYHGIEERIGLLKRVRKAFKITDSYQEMELGLRQTIAGLPNNFNEYWGFFGNMGAAGRFAHAVIKNDPHLSNALDAIPINGPVLRKHYEAYMDEFVQACPEGGCGIGTASRLLAMKRPDYFVCLNRANMEEICYSFGIARLGRNYQKRYWEDIIEPITHSTWWNAARPGDALAGAVWDGRAAMLDAIFYTPVNTEQ